MTRLERVLLVVILILGFTFVARPQTVTYETEGAATVATCLATKFSPAHPVLCITADNHLAVSGNGALPFTTIGGGVAAPISLTINNTTKTLPAAFTIAATMSGGTAISAN